MRKIIGQWNSNRTSIAMYHAYTEVPKTSDWLHIIILYRDRYATIINWKQPPKGCAKATSK